MSDFRYEIKNFVTCFRLEIWHKKSGLVRTQRTNNDQLILVDPVEEDVEEFVHGLILQTSENAI